MKTRWIVVGILTLATNVYGVTPKGDTEMIRQVIEAYMKSGDTQNPAIAEKVLHDDFMLFYIGPDGLMKSTKKEYRMALEKRVIGGDKRTLTVSGVSIMDNVAAATAVMEGGHASFTQYINLAKVEGQWKIMNVVLKFAPKE